MTPRRIVGGGRKRVLFVLWCPLANDANTMKSPTIQLIKRVAETLGCTADFVDVRLCHVDRSELAPPRSAQPTWVKEEEIFLAHLLQKRQ